MAGLGVDWMEEVGGEKPRVLPGSQGKWSGGGHGQAGVRWAGSASDTEPGMSGEEERLVGKWTYNSDPWKLPLVRWQPLGPCHSRG